MATEYVTHQDLNALRADIRGDFAELRGEFAELRGEVRGEIGSLRAEIGTLRGEMGTHTRTIVYANVATMIGVGGLVLAATQLA
jgi:hypothetical protein